MAFPTTDTRNLNDIATVTWRQIIDGQTNLITSSDEKMFQILRMRGAIEPFTGGDEFTVSAIIAGGSGLAEVDPADENPSVTLLASGQQTLAPARYKIFKRLDQVNWATSVLDLNQGVTKVGDVVSAKQLAMAMTMLEQFIDQSETPGGFFFTTSKFTNDTTPATNNAKAMFTDLDIDFAGVDVSTYTRWAPTSTASTSSSGLNLLTSDLTAFINDTDYGSEGLMTDMITNNAVWKRIVGLKAANNVASLSPANVDFGARNTTEHGGIPIHWTRHLSDTAHTSWDNTSTAGDTAYMPIFGIDFNSVCLRIKIGPGMPGDAPAIISRAGPIFMQPTTDFWSQRFQTYGQWYFRKSRRTSGTLQGIETVS